MRAIDVLMKTRSPILCVTFALVALLALSTTPACGGIEETREAMREYEATGQPPSDWCAWDKHQEGCLHYHTCEYCSEVGQHYSNNCLKKQVASEGEENKEFSHPYYSKEWQVGLPYKAAYKIQSLIQSLEARIEKLEEEGGKR